jgi:response regulator of citrate/malate metabolism
MSRIKILIIDDNYNQSEKLKERLINYEEISSVGICNFNESDIEKYIKEYKPNVILLDSYNIDMKSTNQIAGINMAKQKSQEWRNNGIKIIILHTVFDVSEDSVTGKEINDVLENKIVNGHLRKPVTSSDIIKKINSLLKINGEK